MNQPCPKCGAMQAREVSFCDQCGEALLLTRQKGSEPEENGLISSERICENRVSAPLFPGEAILGQSIALVIEPVTKTVTPIKYFFGEAQKFIVGCAIACYDMKKLLPAIVLAVGWLVLVLLVRFGVNTKAVQILSWLTFAQGGVSNNAFHILGGVIGKGIYVFFFTSLIVPIFQRKNPLKNMQSSIYNLLHSFENIEETIVPLLAGIGIALVSYNFMAGTSSPMKNMAAFTGILLALNSPGNKSGFLVGFFDSFRNRKRRKMQRRKITGNKTDIPTMITGIALGFTLAVALSFIPYAWIGYAAGAAFLITAILFLMVKAVKKGAKSA